MKITYGLANKTVDITIICLTKLLNNNIITIPSGDDARASLFSDPIFGTVKKIYILHDSISTEYDANQTIKINIVDNTIHVVSNLEIDTKLSTIQSKLQLKYGSFEHELPEQKMVTRYFTGKEKVLEIGGNIGRNSLIIASILENSSNLVVLECDPNIANQLFENREINNLKFTIENAALSKRKLIQQGWNTIVSDKILDGYQPVHTITLTELSSKYKIEFDTLVLDCEGAFYYILMDMPEIINNVKLIIMENDYWELSHKKYIDSVLTKNNFYRDYVEGGGWGPCKNNFYEVWKRDA
jgi:FkbM family methyltransferase